MFALPFFRRDLPILIGERVRLRTPLIGDYRQWASLRGNSRSFLEPWEPAWTSDELDHGAWRQRLSRYREDFAQGSSIPFFVFNKSTDSLLGGITLSNIRRGVAQSANVGYWIGSAYAGQGYMLEALKLVVEHAFDVMRLHRVEAACIPSNARSIRVLEKAGFQREGMARSYLKINGVWQDHCLYAIIANDLTPARKKGSAL
jgi:ribosomal-protein-alanine N-acetyltransferase